MAFNEGLGAVTQKNQVLVADTLNPGELTAVKHANGQDWWVLTPMNLSNGYYRWLLTPEGFSGPWEQYIGLGASPQSQGSGQVNFSPDGSRYVRYNPFDDLYLFDFDRSTGLLSNFRHLTLDEAEEYWGGAAFSPSGRFLYVSSFAYIYQYDTWADDLAASQVVVAEYDSIDNFIQQNFWQLQLGPDCRLYCFCNSCDVVHVITAPDLPGEECGFVQGGVQLPYSHFRAMPHFPNYRLGPVGAEGLPCVPAPPVNVAAEPTPTASGLRLWPNPGGDLAHLAWPVGEAAPRALWLYDALGRRQALSWEEAGPGEVQFSVAHLPAGVYWLAVHGAGGAGAVTIRFVKQ